MNYKIFSGILIMILCVTCKVYSGEDKLQSSLKDSITRCAQASNSGQVASEKDLMSNAQGRAGMYNRNLALLGALAVSDIYRGANNNDSATLIADGFSNAVSNTRVEYGRGLGKGLEVLTLEKQIENKRYIAIVFEGTDEKVGDWIMNLRGTPVDFPFSRDQKIMTAQEQKKLLLMEKKGLAGYTALSINANVQVHEGFRTMTWDYMMMEGEICFSDDKTLFDLIHEAKTNNNIKFLVFGHSMGGAVATLYSCELAERGVHPSCYTYAAAAAGDNTMVSQFAGKIDYHNFVHPGDPILWVECHPLLTHMNNHYFYTGGNPTYSLTNVGADKFVNQGVTLEFLKSLLVKHYSTPGLCVPDVIFKALKGVSYYHSHTLYALHAFYDVLIEKGTDIDYWLIQSEFMLWMQESAKQAN